MEITGEYFQQERTLSFYTRNIVSVETIYEKTKTSFSIVKEIEDPDTGEVETWSREVTLDEPLNCYRVIIEILGSLRVGDLYVNGHNTDVVFRCIKDYLLEGYIEVPKNLNLKWTNEFTLIGSAFQESNGN